MRPAGAQMLEVSQILTSPVEAVYLPVSTGRNQHARILAAKCLAMPNCDDGVMYVCTEHQLAQ